MPSRDYEQASFQPPEIFAVKGKVYDDILTVSTKSTPSHLHKTHPTRAKASTLQTKTTPIAFIAPIKLHSQPASNSNSFRYPSIQNEEIFNKKLQEAPSTVDSKKFKLENPESLYSYSTIKFSGDDDAKYFTARKNAKNKPKPPKRSTAASFNLEQSFGGNGQVQQTQFDSSVSHANVNSEINGGFRPSSLYQNPEIKTTYKKKPAKLLKSPEDEFKDSEFYDFSIRPRPGQNNGALNPSSTKFSSDLSVKSLAIKPHKNKFDPISLQHGFIPSGSSFNNFKLKDIPNLHGADVGHGVASPKQIKTFYDAIETQRDER